MSKTTPEEIKRLALKHHARGITNANWHNNLVVEITIEDFAALIDEARGVDAESPLSDVRAILYQCDRGNVSLSWFIDALRGIVERAASAPSQPAAMVNLAAETPTQKGIRATLAVQGLTKAFDGLGAGRKDRKMIVTDEMVNRFLMWKLPADFAPDCGISFKSESDYEHPVFGRSKHEPMGTNLLNADQARAMLEHVLTDIQPAAPVNNPDELEPPEVLASRLIDAWCATHGKQIPWAKAVEITTIVTKLSNEERERLLNLD